MKTNRKHEVIAQIAGLGVRLAVLSVFLLGMAGIAQAKASGVAAQAAPKAAAPATGQGKAEPVMVAPGKPAPKGNHEGIQVHGHWIIEVKNPDGTLVSHTEFENALSPGFPVPTGGQASSGEAFLSALLTGQVLSPVTWGIFLEGPNGLTDGTNAPCVVTVLTISPGACLIFQNSLNSNYSLFVCTLQTLPPGTSCNLTATLLGTSPNFTGFQLMGSVVATQPGSVTFVATADFGVCGINGTAQANCAFPSSGSNIAAFTGRPLDGNTPAGVAAGDPNPVTVTTAGQTIAVTVMISFASGN